FDVRHFPKGPARRVAGMGTFGFALTTAAKNPDAAWAFLQFMYGEEGMQIITSSYASVPAMKRFYDSPFWRDLPGPPYHNNVFVDAFSYGTTPPRVPFYSTGPFRQPLAHTTVRRRRFRREWLWALFFLGPNLVLFLGFTLLPVLFGFGISFFRWTIVEPPVFIGLDNYRQFFIDDPLAKKVIGNSLY